MCSALCDLIGVLVLKLVVCLRVREVIARDLEISTLPFILRDSIQTPAHTSLYFLHHHGDLRYISLPTSHLPLMSQQFSDGNPSQTENDRPVKLPIRTKEGQETMDPTAEPSGEKIRFDDASVQTLILLTIF